MALDRRRTMARARRGLPNDNPPPPTRGSTFPRKLFDDNRPRAVIRAERSTEQQERLDAIRQKARQSGRTAESTEAFIREFMGGMELNATQRVILDKLLFGSGGWFNFVESDFDRPAPWVSIVEDGSIQVH